MKFFGLQFVWLFWLIPLWIIIFLWASRSRQKKVKALIDENLWDRMIPHYKNTRRLSKLILLLLALVLIMMSLLRPQWGYELREVQRKGVDLFVLVDTSQSMAASDISPSRIERAKFELYDLIEILNGDRIGLIPFAGKSYVACPLTSDYGAFRIFIDQLQTDLIPVGGTNIEEALSLSLKSFPEGSNNSKAIILITDGEVTLGDRSKVVKNIIDQGIRIYVMGIGSEKGAPIPALEDGGFVKDRDGNLVISKMDESSLKELALKTDGVYVRSINGDLDLEKIYLSGIKKVLQEKDLNSQEREIPIERFQIPLGIGILLLLIQLFMGDIKKVKVLKSLFLVGGLFGLMGNAQAFNPFALDEANQHYDREEYEEALQSYEELYNKSQNSELSYNLGNAYYKKQQFEKSIESYLQALNSSDEELRKKALYNLGNAYLKSKKFDESIQSYQQVLEIDKENEKAAQNLEIAKKLKEIQPPPPQESENQEDKEDKEEQENQKNKENNQDQQENQDNSQQQDSENSEENQNQENSESQEENSQEDSQKNSESKNQEEESQTEDIQNSEIDENQESDISESEKARWLQSLEDDPGEAMKKLLRGKMKQRRQPEKPW